jgi:hypothetical protein
MPFMYTKKVIMLVKRSHIDGGVSVSFSIVS